MALGVSSEVTSKNGSNKKDAFVPYFRHKVCKELHIFCNKVVSE